MRRESVAIALQSKCYKNHFDLKSKEERQLK